MNSQPSRKNWISYSSRMRRIWGRWPRWKRQSIRSLNRWVDRKSIKLGNLCSNRRVIIINWRKITIQMTISYNRILKLTLEWIPRPRNSHKFSNKKLRPNAILWALNPCLRELVLSLPWGHNLAYLCPHRKSCPKTKRRAFTKRLWITIRML